MSPVETAVASVLSDELFEQFRQLIQEETGICMRDSKKLLVSNRLRKRMRQRGVECFSRYLDMLRENRDGERSHFIDAVTTNETYFYREEGHFVALRQVILPELFARKDRVVMWSVGCSSGEEAYAMAIVALEAAPQRARGIEILATDISTAVVARAAEGIYGGRTVHRLPAHWREAYFDATPEGKFRVRGEVRRLVRFSVHNALREEPPARGIDVIFCRNVMIYFDTPTQKRLVEGRFAPALAPLGYLLIGHSESLIGKSSAFTFTRINRAPVYRPAPLRGET